MSIDNHKGADNPIMGEELFWCRICKSNRKLSCLCECYLGCNVCGLVLRDDDEDDIPQTPPKLHVVHYIAQIRDIFDDNVIDFAMFCYTKASASGYLRRDKVLAAICLYISCRTNDVPCMLVEFSSFGVNVYDVGFMLLHVYMFLRDEVDGFQVSEIVDPSFFIHRFTAALLLKENNKFKENNNKFIVVLTALRILADWKSEYVGCWKRLGGLCAAAVYMAAYFNGFDVSDCDDVVSVFRGVVSEKLVKSRLQDLYDDFASVAKECEYFIPGAEYAVCPHYNRLIADDPLNAEKCFHGFCRVCYDKFVKLSGYFCGGLDAKCTECQPADLSNGISVPGEDDEVQVLCSKKRLSSMINFDALREAFGDDEAQSANTKRKESNGSSSNAMEQGHWGDKLAIAGDAHAQDSANNSVRRRFGQPKPPRVRRLGLQR
ncbi:uncharacterized protein LOC141692130 [Apium graveolens]|uniref:uncharacterized protein LOC141692130 n=1 Tax=Apium graveolens TaxID=4045 RepID=UPI003D79E7A4